MNHSALLRYTATRYREAVALVMQSWSPDSSPGCGCSYPGETTAQECPCKAIFEQRLKEAIQALHQHRTHSPNSSAIASHDESKPQPIFSKPQV